MITHEMWAFVRAGPAPFPKITGQIHYLLVFKTRD